MLTVMDTVQRTRKAVRYGGGRRRRGAAGELTGHTESANHIAAVELEAAVVASVRNQLRVVVVGGAPGSWKQLRAIEMPSVALRVVDGVRRRTTGQARADLDWADLVLIWGPTILAHRVSGLYSRDTSAVTVVVRQRGVSALLGAAAEHVTRGVGR